jgi:hypothetical protein
LFGFRRHKSLNKQLVQAAHEGNIHDMALLLEKGADIEARDPKHWDMTVLGIAAHSGHAPAVKFLLERGANIEAPDRDGDTPLINAAQKGRAKALAELLRRGANKDAANHKGLTALDLIAKVTDKSIGMMLRGEEEKPLPAPKPEAPAVTAPVPAGVTNDEITLRREIGNKVLEEIFNFSVHERISLVRDGNDGPVETMVRENFDEIGEKALRRAFDAYASQGGTIPESEIFPGTMAKIKPQPRNP